MMREIIELWGCNATVVLYHFLFEWTVRSRSTPSSGSSFIIPLFEKTRHTLRTDILSGNVAFSLRNIFLLGCCVETYSKVWRNENVCEIYLASTRKNDLETKLAVSPM